LGGDLVTTWPTLPAFIAERLSQPRSIALAERVDGRTIALSAEDVHRRAAAVAFALRARGIGAGDRVAIVSENKLDWLIADFGILYAGGVVVPMFATIAADQLAYIVGDAEAKLVFAGDAATAGHVRDAVASPPPIVVFGASGDDGMDAFVRKGEPLFAARPAELAEFTAQLTLDDLAVLIYTSGTTGTPKGVMLSHRNVISNVYGAYNPAETGFSAGETALSVLPFAHIFEHTDSLGYLYNRVTQYVTTPDRLLEDLRAVRPHYVAGVPRIFERVIAGIVGSALEAGGVKAKLVPWAIQAGAAYERAARAGGANPILGLANALAQALVLKKIKPALGLDRLHYFVSGSAPLHRDTALALAAMGMPVCEGYGLTETSPVVTVNRPNDIKFGTVGTPIDGVQVTLADDGEVLVKGPNVMLGYYHLPAAEQPFTADGWFQTGDIGSFDDDHHLVITDRKKELFKSSGGKWIAPARIETAIKRSIFIGQVMAFGDDQPHPAVLVAPNWSLIRTELSLGSETTTAQMAADDRVRALVIREVEHQTADLASFERVRRVAILPRDLTVEDGELSPTLKVRRRVVERRYEPLILQAYEENLHDRKAALGV
jgi:long-chain acyl-CoA synthetase